MNDLIQQIASWLGFGSIPASPQVKALRTALESGREAKRAEDYTRALAQLDEALRLAQEIPDDMAAAVIELHRTDVLIFLQRWDEAEESLEKLRQEARNKHQEVQLAYTLCALGNMEQARESWSAARDYYEQALELARRINTQGPESRAMGHLADVYLHENNASYAAHLLREALPRLNASGDIELRSYFVGRLGEALIASGQINEGQQLIGQALRQAEQQQDRRLIRLWRLTLGQQALIEARHQDAYRHFDQALPLFDQASESEDYALALCQMSQVSLKLGNYDAALDYARRAEAINRNAQYPAIAGTLGLVLRATGHHAEALPYLEAAAEMYRGQSDHDQDTTYIDMLRNLAAAQAQSLGAQTAIQTYEDAITHAQQIDARLQTAEVHRDLGLLYASEGQPRNAIKQWLKALEIYEPDNYHAQAARLYCDIGNARHQLGQGSRALKDYDQALMLINSVDDAQTRGIVLSNAANAYVDQGAIDSVEAFFKEAIDIARSMNDQEAEATRRGNYGWFLLKTGKYQQAESTLTEALRLSKAIGSDLLTAVQTDNLGLVHDARGEYQAALSHHEQALELISRLDTPHWQAVIKANEGDTRLSLGQIQEATALYEAVLSIGRDLHDIENTIRGLTGQARIALALDQAGSADNALQEAIMMSRRADMRRLLANALVVQSQQQAALEQPEKATALWEEARKLYAVLHAPQAKQTPSWLGNGVID